MTFDRSTWRTPAGIVEAVRSELGGIDIDPATSTDNPTGARWFYAPGGTFRDEANGGQCQGPDGLSMPMAWPGDRLFLNPPWRKGMTLAPWTDRARAWFELVSSPEQGKDGPGIPWNGRGLGAVLVPASLNAAWFHRLLATKLPPRLRMHVFAFRQRVHFVDPTTGETPRDSRPNFDTVLVVCAHGGIRDCLGWRLDDHGFGGRWL